MSVRQWACVWLALSFFAARIQGLSGVVAMLACRAAISGAEPSFSKASNMRRAVLDALGKNVPDYLSAASYDISRRR
jgi:hypothetical protein